MENMKKKTWLEKEIAKIQKDYDITYYSDTEMETENLTEAQFYFVDEIMGEVIAEISYEIFLSGEFPDWKIEEIVKEVNENLGIDYHGIWGTDEAYDSYYDEDKEVVKARIHEAIDSEFDEHNDILREKIEEYDDDDNDDNDDEGMCFEDLDDEEEIPTNEIAGIGGAKMLVHSYDEKWGTFRRIFQFDNMHYYNEDGEIVEYGSGMYTVSKSKSGLYASLKIGNKPFAISPEDAKSLFGWAQLHVNDLAIKKMAKEVNKPVEEVRKIWQDNLLDGWNFDNRLEYEEFRDFYVL